MAWILFLNLVPRHPPGFYFSFTLVLKPCSFGEFNLRNGQNDHILRKQTEPFLCNIMILNTNYYMVLWYKHCSIFNRT